MGGDGVVSAGLGEEWEEQERALVLAEALLYGPEKGEYAAVRLALGRAAPEDGEERPAWRVVLLALEDGREPGALLALPPL